MNPMFQLFVEGFKIPLQLGPVPFHDFVGLEPDVKVAAFMGSTFPP
ncbi:MAG: hypothetical protein WA609_16570 [Terriglobales bacterium]